MKRGIKKVRTLSISKRKAWRVFMPGMVEPTYHANREEAKWAMRLRGYMI